jgi:hypothetical protein
VPRHEALEKGDHFYCSPGHRDHDRTPGA